MSLLGSRISAVMATSIWPEPAFPASRLVATPLRSRKYFAICSCFLIPGIGQFSTGQFLMRPKRATLLVKNIDCTNAAMDQTHVTIAADDRINRPYRKYQS